MVCVCVCVCVLGVIVINIRQANYWYTVRAAQIAIRLGTDE